MYETRFFVYNAVAQRLMMIIFSFSLLKQKEKLFSVYERAYHTVPFMKIDSLEINRSCFRQNT